MHIRRTKVMLFYFLNNEEGFEKSPLLKGKDSAQMILRPLK